MPMPYLAKIRDLGNLLGMTEAQLLLMAREIQGDACMLSLRHMTIATQAILLRELQAVKEKRESRMLVAYA
jgi:hypothetical protein